MWPALVVAVLLAGLTGFVDAVAFDRFLGVFVANQSGNAVFLGMAIGGSSVSTVWRPAHLDGRVRARHRRRASSCGAGCRGPRLGAWLLVCELALFVVVIAITGPIDRVHLIGGGEGFLLIVLTSMAMGVQTEVIRHVAGTAVATTYQTGAIARMGEAVSRVLSRTSAAARGARARWSCCSCSRPTSAAPRWARRPGSGAGRWRCGRAGRVLWFVALVGLVVAATGVARRARRRLTVHPGTATSRSPCHRRSVTMGPCTRPR